MKKYKIFVLSLLISIQFSCSSTSRDSLLVEEKQKDEMGVTNDVSHYPEFSWSKIPLYMHVRKNTAYTKEEIEFLASFPLITLEKSQAQGTYGSTEEGTLATAKSIKMLNNKSKILYYRNTVINWSNYKDDDAFVTEFPSSLLTNDENELVYMPNGSTPFFDITKEFVQEYWLRSIEDMVDNPNIDGAFIDANIKILVPSFFANRVGVEKQVQLEKSYFSMMSQLQSKLEGDIMLANIIRVRPDFDENGLEYLHYFDGSYLEGFDSESFGMSYAEYVSQGIEATQKAAQSGKIIAMTLGLGEAIDANLGIDDRREDVNLEDEELNKRVDFLLSIFLICAEKHSYLYLHDGYLSSISAVWQHQFEQFDRALGVPLNRAVKQGCIYTRQFENVDVWLDIENKKAKLTWK